MTTDETTPITPEVAEIFESYEPAVRAALLELRQLILATADEISEVGTIEEALRWGQPSYLTSQTKSGSTIRVAPTSSESDFDYALLFICHTNLLERFEGLFGDLLTYDGTRALLFSLDQPVPRDEVRECVTMALTYHLSPTT